MYMLGLGFDSKGPTGHDYGPYQKPILRKEVLGLRPLSIGLKVDPYHLHNKPLLFNSINYEKTKIYYIFQ